MGWGTWDSLLNSFQYEIYTQKSPGKTLLPMGPEAPYCYSRCYGPLAQVLTNLLGDKSNVEGAWESRIHPIPPPYSSPILTLCRSSVTSWLLGLHPGQKQGGLRNIPAKPGSQKAPGHLLRYAQPSSLSNTSHHMKYFLKNRK